MDFEEDEERRQLKSSLILRRRQIRDLADPFNVTEEAFTAKYHLTQDLVRSVVDLVRPYVRRTTSALAVPLHIKVLCALGFYAKGSYQVPTGQSFDIALAQPTVSVILEEITNALNHPQVAGRLIQFPRTRAQQEMCCERNRNLGGRMPNVVGYVDGSLFRIMKPSTGYNELAYIGRKHLPCVNVQFVCDRSLYFLNCLPRFPGAAHDQHIFNHSSIRQIMQDLHDPQQPCFLLGDSGYNPEPWILTPFARREEPAANTSESRYNTIHSKDRVWAEIALGLLCSQFRCLNSERTLHYIPSKVFKIVLACTGLHNLNVISRNAYYLDYQHRQEQPVHVNLNNHQPANPREYQEDVNLGRQGKILRRQVVQYLEQHREQNGL